MLKGLRRQGLTGGAWALLVLRGGTVAVHLAVMLWLAHWLGLATFGALAHLWAVGMLASTVLATGGPLVILRARHDQAAATFVRVGVLHPLTVACVLATAFIWNDAGFAWFAVLALALAIAFVQSVASVLRVWGSVSVSMILRDGAPVMVLGAVAIWPETPEVMVLRTAMGLAILGLGAVIGGVVRTGFRFAEDVPNGRQGSLWLSSLLGMAQAQIDLVIAGIFLPAEVFGAYALLRRIANLVALPVSVSTWVCAGPVSDAFARADGRALARATAQASAIAWYPALLLLVCAIAGGVGLPLVPLTAFPTSLLPVFGVLLGGALLQAYWAASYPVANLGPSPAMAIEARGVAVLLYAIVAIAAGDGIGALGHAAAYTLSMTVGSVHLWRRLWRAFAVDTSARVLWRQEAVS